ncbi:MAG: hypothetical protein CMJ13_00165 [Pelagibacterales bacterium]|nr:hypothetical protein [Pelagibacterales bacterium]
MCFLYCNNALFSSEYLCSKNLITASKLKKIAVNATNSKNLSECKYYALNLSREFVYFIKNKKCNCFNKEINVNLVLDNAENSENLKTCINNSYKFLNKLDLIVENIISCKKKDNLQIMHFQEK